MDDLCRHLDERLGRPSKDPHVVIGVLLLRPLHDLSDAATVEALAFNMAWHYALDVRGEADSYFREKTLRHYRRLFIAHGLDALLLQRLTDRLVRAFSVDTSRQRMVSTALRSAMRALTRLGIVVETISKFARALERFHPVLYDPIDDALIRRYVVREGRGCFANTAPGVSKRRQGEAGQDRLALAVRFRDTCDFVTRRRQTLPLSRSWNGFRAIRSRSLMMRVAMPARSASHFEIQRMCHAIPWQIRGANPRALGLNIRRRAAIGT